VYHIQLRQFPHNLNHFNMDDRELRSILYPWIADQYVELGERKWSALQAQLTVLSGPELPVTSLSMGRGWRAAEREGTDVTEEMLALARQELAAHADAQRDAPARAPDAQSVAVGDAGTPSAIADAPEMTDQAARGVPSELLGARPQELLAAWRRIAARAPGLTPSESLALAERELAGPGGGR
jgi:hypothetical protein